MKFPRLTALGLALLGLTAGGLSAAPPEVEKYFPAKTDAIISLNIKNVLESDVVKKYALDQLKNVMKANKETSQAIEALGIDPLKDIEAAYVAVHGEQAEKGEQPNQPKATIVLKGRFDAEKINAAMEAFSKQKPEEVSVMKVGAKVGFKFANKDQPQPMFGVVADASTVVFANEKKDVEAALVAEKSELKKELADLFAKANPKAAVTMVSWLKGKLKDVPVPDENAKAIIKDLELVLIEVKAAKDIDFEITAGLASKESVESLNMQLEGFLMNKEALAGLVGMQRPDLKSLGEVIKSLTAKADGQRISITAKMTSKVIEELLEKK